MNSRRFSTHGLACACADLLKERGIDAKAVFRPHSSRDMTPFEVVERGKADQAMMPTGLAGYESL